MITIQELSILVVMFCTATTLILSTLSFKRNRRFDNENTLFRIKVEGYFVICDQMNELADLLNDSANYMENIDLYLDELFESANKIHSKTMEIFSIALKYSIVFSQEILNELDLLNTAAIPIKKDFDEPEKMENLFALYDNQYNSIFAQMDELYKSMRKDIGSEKLNKTLSRRIR